MAALPELLTSPVITPMTAIVCLLVALVPGFFIVSISKKSIVLKACTKRAAKD